LGSWQAASATDWTGWQPFVSLDGVSLYINSRTRSCGSDVRWQARNQSGVIVWPSVVDKVYTCSNGAQITRSDETVGSSRLQPGDSAATIADSCLCGEGGAVTQVEAALSLRYP